MVIINTQGKTFIFLNNKQHYENFKNTKPGSFDHVIIIL